MSDAHEKFKFGKFMTDIVEREETQREKLLRQEEEPNESPQRRLERLYRERWQNQIRWSPAKGK